MSLFDYEKEKQLQEDLENLFESKVRISKKDLVNFLKKDESPKEEVASVESEELKFVDVKDKIEPDVDVVEKEESIDNDGFVESPKPKIMDRLLDEYEDNKESKEESKEDAKVVYWGGGENNSIVTLGNGTSIYKDKFGSELRLKSLSATGSTSITEVGDVVVISSTVSGTDSWSTVSGDYYTSDEVDDLISAVSATSTIRITSADSPYNISNNDIVIFANTNNQADVSANLPAGVEGRRVRITNTGTTDAGKVYVVPNGSENLFGDNTAFEMIEAETIEIYFNTTDGWW